MINFNDYLGQHIVLSTKYYSAPTELSGIRIDESKIFRYNKQYVIARILTASDLKDEDFVLWLQSMWARKEVNLKHFIKYRKEYVEGIKSKISEKTKINGFKS